MRRIIFLGLLSFLTLFGGLFRHNLFAETRQKPNVVAYTSDTLIKRGDAKIYHIDYVVTAANGGFTIYDSLTADAESNVKTEGSQATANNGGHIDFTNKPLELSTGFYLDVVDCRVVITWD